ncbi:hypothetical protein [Natronolimnobius baerhuensis]|uniref:Uncharacterized protein n=1 Tax=Natronolimnobius baerhuensis TaxID=253108 RepID=A0A202E536_9EURY|nr:hypothetical protein [Natronolimnobius baerhuensis]OVE83365.1 hypothetical protein B2G88_12945 [Natronolimnobius baerhuensis]
MDVRPTAVLALVLAYPTTFVLLTGEHSCGPVCLEPTAAGVAGLGGVVLASVAVAAVSSAVFALESRCAGKPFLEQLLCPNSVALAAIWGLFGGFLVALLVESAGLLEGEPVVLFASMVVYPFVWLLYGLTGPISLLVGLVGVEPGVEMTMIVRAVILGLGFALSLCWQLSVVGLGRWTTNQPTAH